MFNRVFRAGPRARELALNVLDAESAEREHHTYATEALGNFSDLHPDIFLLDALRSVEKKSMVNCLEAAREAARLLEGSRSKEFEIFILSAATLLGAAAGAAASLIAKWFGTDGWRRPCSRAWRGDRPAGRSPRANACGCIRHSAARRRQAPP